MSPWCKERRRACIWWIKLFAVWPRWELNSILFRPSPSSIKIPPLTTNLGFSFPILSLGWKVFSSTISMIFRFSSPIFSSSSEIFHQLIPLSDFPPQSLLFGLGGISSAIWFFETHQLPYGARVSSLIIRFFSSIFHHLGWEVFHWVPIQVSYSRFPSKFPFNRFHAQRNSRSKWRVIVITWPLE